MSRKIAFAGLRHGHINALFQAALESSELEITAICEEDPTALQAFLDAHKDLQLPVYSSLKTIDSYFLILIRPSSVPLPLWRGVKCFALPSTPSHRGEGWDGVFINNYFKNFS
jgi:hypothetical protein